MGTYYRPSRKHLHGHGAEFCGRYNTCDESTLERIGPVVDRLRGKRLAYVELVS